MLLLPFNNGRREEAKRNREVGEGGGDGRRRGMLQDRPH